MGAHHREETADEALMLRFQGGDRASFALLVKRHKTPIYNFILRQIRAAPAAEDLTQDVFVKIVQKAAEFKHEARFTTWAYAIARNVCIDHLCKMSLRRHPSPARASAPPPRRPSSRHRSRRTPRTSRRRPFPCRVPSRPRRTLVRPFHRLLERSGALHFQQIAKCRVFAFALATALRASHAQRITCGPCSKTSCPRVRCSMTSNSNTRFP